MAVSRFSLADKVAIITGSGRGIGKGIAIGFAEAGAKVVVTSRTASQVQETTEMLRKMGADCIGISVDLRKYDQVEKLAADTISKFGRIDVLVNNAGSFSRTLVLNTGIDQWNNILELNLTSNFICSKIVGAQMAKQKSGSIINISSVAGLGAFPGAAGYGVTKAGIINLTKTLSVEFGAYNVRVNCIAPGFVRTPGADNAFANLEGRVKRLDLIRQQYIPLGRLGNVEDIADAAIFFASDASSYITGETISVSGGLVTSVLELDDEPLAFRHRQP
jgi:NAD(P)-dependent dehydrogenase (short-subunit alcohol dehydrogenase family)